MFRPNLYHRVVHPPIPRPKKNRTLIQKVTHALNPFKKTVLGCSLDTPHHHPPSARNISEEDVEIKTNVLEVWFAGCHSGTCIQNMGGFRISEPPGSLAYETHFCLLLLLNHRCWRWPREGLEATRAVEPLAALDGARARQGKLQRPL